MALPELDYLTSNVKWRLAMPDHGPTGTTTAAYEHRNYSIGIGIPEAPPVMTRKRYLQLTKIAEELCNFLENKGVTRTEGCRVRALAECIWDLPKGETRRKRNARP